MISFKNKKTKNPTKENGRSMIEMLGVIAIIGVLSIAGFSGYKLAMNKYKTNELLNTLNKFVELCANQRDEFENFNCSELLSELGKKNKPYAWEFISKAGEKNFSLSIPNMDKAICQNIAQLSWTRLKNTSLDTESGTEISSPNLCPQQGKIILTFADNSILYANADTENNNPEDNSEPPRCSENEILHEGKCLLSCPTDTFKSASNTCTPCNSIKTKEECSSFCAKDSYAWVPITKRCMKFTISPNPPQIIY